MKIFISVDDTDNIESPGSGQLSANLAQSLLEKNLVARYSNISRHQLYLHPSIPYTSGNSSMCFTADTETGSLTELIRYAGDYLQDFSAPGSDPGLCVAMDEAAFARSELVAFGREAKHVRLDKTEAYALADRYHIHLSEHGGSGLGVIGALAGLGLRMAGNDGRFRGWLQLGQAGAMTTVGDLKSHPWVDDVIDNAGCCLADDASVILVEEKIKTVLRRHRQVIVVKAIAENGGTRWRTCTKAEAKTF
jgi:hypothetical protein